MVKLRFLRSGLLSAALVAGLTTAGTAQTTLNLSSSVTAQCVGGVYSLASACEAVRFTLNIPSIQTLNSTGEVLTGGVAAPGGTFTNFLVSTFGLQSTSAAWQFFTPNALLAAAPGIWFNQFTVTNQTVNASIGGAVGAPISFDIRFANYTPDLSGMQIAAQSAGFQAVEIGGLNRQANWSSSTNVVTPEPVSMTLLGTGLFGLAAARRRKKQQQTEV